MMVQLQALLKNSNTCLLTVTGNRTNPTNINQYRFLVCVVTRMMYLVIGP